MKEFADKVAVITGGASGIGRAAAIAFARDGARVLVADIGEEGGRETVALIRDGGGEAAFVKADVSIAADVAAMVERAVDEFGGLDIAFNNAGYDGARGTVIDLSEEDFDRSVAINLKSVFLCMKFEIPEMLKRGGGAIVNTSSGLGMFALPRTAAYASTKHGVIGLGKAAAVDFGPYGIRINTLAPGKTATPMLLASAQRAGVDINQTCGTMPLRRPGRPEEQADAVVWLCSSQSSFVTGATIVVDGGSTAVRA